MTFAFTLLDEPMIAELFSLADVPESRAMLQDMYGSLYTAAETELPALEAGLDPAVMRTRLHSQKGMMANYGFASCARLLAEWEREGTPEQAVARRSEVQMVLQRSRAELRRRYPWLP